MTSLLSWHQPLRYDPKDGRKQTKLDKSSCIYFLFQKKKKQKTLRIPNEYVNISPAGVSAVMVEWELVSFGDTGMEVQHLLGPQPRG